MAEARAVFPDKKILQTSIGKIDYDYLVFAAGATTNFFGNKNVEEWSIPMRTLSEAMGLRNALLSNLERALTCATEEERQELLNVVIVGGGATGVEIAGAISEMKRYVIPYDYPDMDASHMHIYLLEAGDRLLAGMSQEASEKALEYLRGMGVDVQFGKMVTDYRDYRIIITTDHGSIRATNPVKIIGDRNTNTNLRYKLGKNLSYDSKDLFVIKDPQKAHLPAPNLSTSYVFATGDDFFAYPNNYNYYVSYYRNTFQHGGISMEEMIIPIVTLKGRKR